MESGSWTVKDFLEVKGDCREEVRVRGDALESFLGELERGASEAVDRESASRRNG